MVSIPSDPLLTASRVSFKDTVGATTARSSTDSDMEKMTAPDYIQSVNVMFEDLRTDMVDHDVVLDRSKLLGDYCASPSEVSIFAPTALRQIHHFYANYVQSLQFLAHPTLDFNDNRKELTQNAPVTGPQTELVQSLSQNLHQMHEAIRIFRENVTATDTVQQEHLQEKLQSYQERLMEMTEKFCADNHFDMMPVANQNHAAQKASAYKPPAKRL